METHLFQLRFQVRFQLVYQLGAGFEGAKSLGLTISVDTVVLHTVVVAGELGAASGPRTSVVALTGVDAVMARQVAQRREQAPAHFAHVAPFRWRLRRALRVLRRQLRGGGQWVSGGGVVVMVVERQRRQRRRQR